MTSAANLFTRPSMFRAHPEIRRILITQLSALGDVILATPLAHAARQAFPDAKIDLLTRPLGAEVLQGNPDLDEILVYPQGVALPWKLLREVRGRRYDLVLDSHSVPRTAIVTAFSGAKYRYGMRGRGPRNWCYTGLIPKGSTPYYVAKGKAQLLGFLGVPLHDLDLSLRIVITEQERAWANELWRRLGLDDGRPVVAVSAVHRQWFKNWGPERWARVADDLIEGGATVLLTNGPGEREQVEAVVRAMEHEPVWDYGPTSPRQLCAIYEKCTLWVGNDGGPKHMAVAMGCPTVTVSRWQISEHWTDLRPGSPHQVIEKAPPQGCDLRCHHCPHLGCLTAIEPEEVLNLTRARRTPSRAVQLGPSRARTA